MYKECFLTATRVQKVKQSNGQAKEDRESQEEEDAVVYIKARWYWVLGSWFDRQESRLFQGTGNSHLPVVGMP